MHQFWLKLYSGRSLHALFLQFYPMHLNQVVLDIRANLIIMHWFELYSTNSLFIMYKMLKTASDCRNILEKYKKISRVMTVNSVAEG
jgi:hypothetical protein